MIIQEENLDLAKKSLEVNKKDLELMKDYVTTTEVRQLNEKIQLPFGRDVCQSRKEDQ